MEYGKGMVKKWLCLAVFMGVLLLLLTPIARAEEIDMRGFLDKIPAVDNGFYYSLEDSGFNYSATIKALQTKDERFALNVGYAGRQENTKDKLIATASLNLLKVQDYINVPILKYVVIEPYIAAGFGSINLKALKDSEFDYGIGANIIRIRL